jgi:hypothetical protein
VPRDADDAGQERELGEAVAVESVAESLPELLEPMRVDRSLDVGHVPEAAVLPECDGDERGEKRDGEHERGSPAAREDVCRGGREEKQRVGGVERDRQSGEQAGERRVHVLPPIERRDGEVRGDQDARRARKPARAREPEALREQDAFERRPVAAAREREREVRHDDPARGAQVPEPAAADAARDGVHRDDREREHDERLEQDEQRQAFQVVRAADRRQRRRHERPGKADERRREVPVCERPRRRPVRRPRAVLGEEPRVVLDASREQEQQQPLQQHERHEHVPRLAHECGGSAARAHSVDSRQRSRRD